MADSPRYDLSNICITTGGSLRKTLATLALSGLLLAGLSAPPASASSLAPSAVQAESEYQITDLSLRIVNDPRLLSLGYNNAIAHGGSTVTAHASAPGAEKIEYFWVPDGHDAPKADTADEGAIMVLDSSLWFDRVPVTVWARATWSNGETRTTTTVMPTSIVTGQTATFKAPDSVHPGAAISSDIIQLSPMAKAAAAAAEQGYLSIIWRAQSKENQGQLWHKANKFGPGSLAIQPSCVEPT